MIYTPARLLLVSLPLASAIRAPDGPSQQCADDAGPPWSDDNDEFGKNGRYHDNTPGTPILNADGSCPDPLKKACETKPAKAAFLDGPVDCGGQGWFCRIIEEEKSWKNPEFDDSNFMHCNDTALVDDPADLLDEFSERYLKQARCGRFFATTYFDCIARGDLDGFIQGR